MAADNTAPKQRGVPFEPGKSGNPSGRPKGSKNKLTEAFWQDMSEVWSAGGKDALDRVIKDDPGAFVRIAASLMPKEAELTLRTIAANQLGDDELADIAVGSGEGTDTPPLDPQVTH